MIVQWVGSRDLCIRFTTKKLFNWLLSNLLKSCPRAQFLTLTCLRGQCVFYPCLDNDYNTWDVLPLFWVAFFTQGRLLLQQCFPLKVFPLLGPCSTGHSLSKTAPSTHLHMPSIYVRYNCCIRGRLVKKCSRLYEHQFCPKLYLRDRICA